MTEGHRDLVCEDCGESPNLVALDGGVDYGVECGCEYSEGTPVGRYVEISNSVPDSWSETADSRPEEER